MSVMLFSGTFDPFTNGHLEIIRKASKIGAKVIVGIANNPLKERKLEIEKMIGAMRETLVEENISNCEIVAYNKLTIDFARENNVDFLVRGLRDNVDYNYEENLAKFNYEQGKIDTIYIRSNTNISSTFIHELIKYKKDISNHVPQKIKDLLEQQI